MLLIRGQLSNSYIKEGGINRQTGEMQPPRLYLQIMQKTFKEDGTFTLELKDVKADIDFVQSVPQFLNKDVRIPISLFSPKSNTNIYFSMPKGSVPTVVPPNIVSPAVNHETASPKIEPAKENKK